MIDVGLTELEASLVFRTAMAVHTELLERNQREEVTREQALELGQRALGGLVAALRADRREVS